MKLQHEPKECVITSENSQLLEEIKKQYPFTNTIHYSFDKPSWSQERVFAIAEGRDQLRKYVCDHKDVEWLLMIDGDVETESDLINILWEIARQGYDVVLSRRVGLILFMHRDVCESVKWFTQVCYRDHRLYLEETHQVERQIEEYNHWRETELKLPPIFKVYFFESKSARHKNNPLGVY